MNNNFEKFTQRKRSKMRSEKLSDKEVGLLERKQQRAQKRIQLD